MYGNSPLGNEPRAVQLSAEQRQALRRDLESIVSQTRELLPASFTVGSELSSGTNGPRATIAVQPPVGRPVSAAYTPENDEEIGIDPDRRDDLAHDIAASAALQVKQAMARDTSPSAQ
ncbi:MAG: DUF5811 family protein [Haloarculaceae archaeon]